MTLWVEKDGAVVKADNKQLTTFEKLYVTILKPIIYLISSSQISPRIGSVLQAKRELTPNKGRSSSSLSARKSPGRKSKSPRNKK